MQLFYHVIQTEIVHVLFQIAVLSVIVILLYVTAILHRKMFLYGAMLEHFAIKAMSLLIPLRICSRSVYLSMSHDVTLLRMISQLFLSETLVAILGVV